MCLRSASLNDEGSRVDRVESSELCCFFDNFSRDPATRDFDFQDTANVIFSLKPVLPALVQRGYASTREDVGQQSGFGQVGSWARHHLARMIRFEGPVRCLARHVPLAHRYGQRHADLRYPPVLPMFYSDDKKWAQILCNVIANALRFSPQGRVRACARLEGDTHVHFGVQDSGIAMSVELHECLFEDFVPLDPLLQKHPAGTGLNLPICKHFCKHFEAPLSDLMRGDNVVEQVYVVLPVTVAAENARGH